MRAWVFPLRTRWRRAAAACLLAAAALYGLLSIPEPLPPPAPGAGRQAFVWNRDAFWSELEAQFVRARAAGALAAPIRAALDRISGQLDGLAGTDLPPDAPVFDALEAAFFQLGPMVAASPEHLPEFVRAFGRMRGLVKRQSEHWPMAARATRDRLYRLLYGGRAAIEEAMLQAPRDRVVPLVAGTDEPSATPAAAVQGVTLHSGDLLVSRGGAATSALIARGNDFRATFRTWPWCTSTRRRGPSQ